MRLDFNVLWVDDQPDRVAAQIDAIKRRMEGEGFQLVPTMCKSMDEVRGNLGDDLFTDEVDLILVDWDLGQGAKGQDVIAEVREHAPYKDVVFYSAQTPPDELRKSAFDKQIEGIYCTTRQDLVEEVTGVFESLVKKVLDLDHTRGIVMGATSDIDYMVNECLAVIHAKLDGPGKEAMRKQALRHVDRRMKDLAKIVEKLEKATSMAEFAEQHMIFTANDRLRMLHDRLQGGPHAAYREKVTEYQKKVVPDRNILGHMVLVPDGKPKAVMGNDDQAVTVEVTREIRRMILSLRSDFRSLLAALQA